MGSLDKWMGLALDEARAAGQEGEVPIGAVVVKNGELISRAHNRTIRLGDPTGHAEILALRAAADVVSNYRLKGSEIYVTLEPCPMCAGALIWARVQRVIFALRDPKAGAICSKISLLEPGLFNHSPDTVEGVGRLQSLELLENFFQGKRRKNRMF